jgi:hypothetical protein
MCCVLPACAVVPQFKKQVRRTLSNRIRVASDARKSRRQARSELNVWRDTTATTSTTTGSDGNPTGLSSSLPQRHRPTADSHSYFSEGEYARQSSRMLRKMSGRRREITQDDPSLEALRLQKEVLLLQKQILDKASGVSLSSPGLFSPQLQLPVVTQAMPVSRVAKQRHCGLQALARSG